MSAKLSKADHEIIAKCKRENDIETNRSVAGSLDETIFSKHTSDTDDDCWNQPHKTLRITFNETKLRWDQLQWKPQKDHFLQCSADRDVYKNDVMFALQSIKYVKEIKLTKLDEANFVTMIRRSVSEGLRGIIEDLSSETDMIKFLKIMHRQPRMTQAKAFFNELLGVLYDGGNSIDFLTNFRVCVRDFKSTGQGLD
ncbi:hypothetical protein GcM3_028048 [Golovinomyces cichoracearum]|uniref:Uncharacterized protein n=1 Tax=Golovinomyces cichoracearum TaxID=62708 RepID=A0A420J5F8_9PEZI|nr:hypothetical protein GcM3_028048 [Golovinomyces cichoracearum]